MKNEFKIAVTRKFDTGLGHNLFEWRCTWCGSSGPVQRVVGLNAGVPIICKKCGNDIFEILPKKEGE